MQNRDSLKVVMVGAGYVGLTTSLCLAYVGHHVICIDKNPVIVERLNRGEATIYEPGVQELLRETAPHIKFSTDLAGNIPGADIIMIAVGTPQKDNGDADLSHVEEVARQIGSCLAAGSSLVVVNKSTVPVGSARRVQGVISRQLAKRGLNCTVAVASNPEFLREGAALFDTFYPDRIVVGSDSIQAVNALRQLYAPLLEQTFNPPRCIPRPDSYPLPVFVTTRPTSAELVKYAANSFLAMKISFINEFAGIADRVGADIREVARGIGLDKRIGPRFLSAGLGWGGSCFPKDTRAIIHTGLQYNYDMPLTRAAVQVNGNQRKVAVEKLQSALKVIRGSTIGILGLSFKPNTDDIRDAPSGEIIRTLLEMGATVRVYDPVAMHNYKAYYPEQDIFYATSCLDAARGSDALLLLTDWEEFSSVDWQGVGGVMEQKILIDGRNLLPRESLERAGFIYNGIGC